MKSLFALALILGSAAASAADLSAVGTNGVEVGVNYDYLKFTGSPWLSQHTATAELQVNLGGLGSLAVDAGDQQTVGSFRNDSTVFSVTYANGFKLGNLGLVEAGTFTDATGDRWFFSGKNSQVPVKTFTETTEANYTVTSMFKPFVNFSHSDGGVNAASAGTYVYLTPKVELTVGYTKVHSERPAQGLVSSLSYSF